MLNLLRFTSIYFHSSASIKTKAQKKTTALKKARALKML
jgi:hypothetical protein